MTELDTEQLQLKGKLRDTTIAFAKEIPVLGRFLSIALEIDAVWRRNPQERRVLATEIVERAAVLIKESGDALREHLIEMRSELSDGLDELEQLVRERPGNPAVELLFEAAINEGLFGKENLALAEFAARVLDELDLRFLVNVFDKRWETPRTVKAMLREWGGLTVYEAGYRLNRLQECGFLYCEPGESEKPVGSRRFRLDSRQIRTFCTGLQMIRVIEVVPDLNFRATYGVLDRDRLEEAIEGFSWTYKGRPKPWAAAAVRRNVFAGYEWSIQNEGHRAEFVSGFPTAAEAKAKADVELAERGVPAEWFSVAA